MQRFIQLKAIAAPLPLDNIDTDKILPGEYLKTVSRAGLGRVLFARLRYNDDGSEKPDFILNREPWRNAGILIGGENFGSGSSREHAPWALVDFGIRAVIARSFADIFYNNCFKNGILPVVLDPHDHERLLLLSETPSSAEMQIDLADQRIVAGALTVQFEIDAGAKAGLMQGRDEIAETLGYQTQIEHWRSENLGRYAGLTTPIPAD